MPRVSELLYGVAVRGYQVKMAQIEGADVTVESVGFFESDFAPGAAVQCVHGENEVWFLTFSSVVIETLEKLKGLEPYQAMFMSHKSASGRTYWTIE